MKDFLGGKQASEKLGVHQRTLYQWEQKGLIEVIRTPGNKRMYNVKKYLEEHSNIDETEEKELENELENQIKVKDKLNLSYVRVSSRSQINDLQRQKKIIKEKYPDHLMIEDIGSGINLNKRGLKKIIKLAIEGKVNELVIAYKDRLARFGYELIEDLIKEYSNGKIIILGKKDDLEPEEELMKDVLEVMNVFVAKMNGLRKYKKLEKSIKKEKIEKKN